MKVIFAGQTSPPVVMARTALIMSRAVHVLNVGSQASPAQGSGQGGRDYQSRFDRQMSKIIDERRLIWLEKR
jgi:hypothetical protein